MEIYLLRHGIAEEARAGQPDADRQLTPEGKKRLREVLKAARAAGVQPSLILTSPYVRAAETARIAAEILGYSKKPVECAPLTPGGDPEDAWKEIRSQAVDTDLLIAGHELALSRLAGYLLGSPSLSIDFKKGAIMRVDVEPPGNRPRGVLKWMLVPRLVGSGSSKGDR